MSEFIYKLLFKEKDRQLIASKKALRYAVNHFCDLQGQKVTGRDVQEFLANVKRIETE